jgi:hypothetical protein
MLHAVLGFGFQLCKSQQQLNLRQHHTAVNGDLY